MIDCGADLIIGSHGHVPKPIEIYKGKLIIYCLGNLIFPFSEKAWGINLVAKITLSDLGKYQEASFYPIDSEDKNCYSPYLMKNDKGDALLNAIKIKSKKLFKVSLQLSEHFLKLKDFN